MKPLRQRTLLGPILAEHLGGGLWQLTAAGAHTAQVFMKFAPGVSSAALNDPAIRRLDLQWRLAGVVERVTGRNGVAMFEVGTAIIHEGNDQLYGALPLAGFDTKARRFWKRVFLLMHVPGGRYLLRWIVRRKR